MMESSLTAGDWVVCLDNSGGGFSKGSLYKTKGFNGIDLLVERDDLGSKTNGWLCKHFRKATPDEIIDNWELSSQIEKLLS
jgi:hypothetical protein